MKGIVSRFEQNLWPAAGALVLFIVVAVGLAVIWLTGSSHDRRQARDAAVLAERIDSQQRQIFELIYRVDDVAAQNHDALCGYKRELRDRLRTTEQLLASTDAAVIEAYGLSIPRDVLKNNRRGQRDAFESLSALKCP